MKRLLASAILLITCACSQGSPLITESVLTEGMKIIASTPSGKVVIEGKKGFNRTYSGEGWAKASQLTPRTTRWYGSLGLYDPAGSNSPYDRLLLDEGRQFFSSESEALRYFKAMSGFFGPLTYNNSGLVIAYKITPIPGGLPVRHLTIWQIYLNGARPTSLRGATDKNIEVSGGEIPDKATVTPAPFGYERELADKEYEVSH